MDGCQFKVVNGNKLKLKRKIEMPLIKSTKPEAFKKNIKTEIASGKNVKQAVAIAYAEKNAAAKKDKKKKWLTL